MFQGGANLTVFYEIPTNGTFSGTPTPVMTLNKTVSTNFDTLIKKGVKIDLDQILNNPKLATFLDTYTNDSAAGGGAEEITLEDGIKEGGGGGTGGDPKLLFITYGGVAADGADNRRVVIYGCAELTEVGGFKMEAQKFARRAVKWGAVKATKDITLVAGMFDDTMIDTADAAASSIGNVLMGLGLTIQEGKFGKEAWVLIP